MRYDVEADWHLLDTCNYRCGYCFSPDHVLGRKLQTFASHAEWRAAFDRTGLTWLLHLTGGEPTIYPGFADLCRLLSQRHVLSFNSNLSRGSVRAFAEQVDPRRVSFINAGLHRAERDRKRGLATFVEHVKLLSARGFPVFISIVATPAVLADMDAVAQSVAATGLPPVPKVLRGKLDERRYPRDYTDAEKQTFRRWAEQARAFYLPRFAGARLPTINAFADDEVLDGVPSFVGRSCSAGRRFVSITPAGDVHRCSKTLALGNVLAGTFARARRSAPCDTRYCFYFCQKYAPAQPATAMDYLRERLPARLRAAWTADPDPARQISTR